MNFFLWIIVDIFPFSGSGFTLWLPCITWRAHVGGCHWGSHAREGLSTSRALFFDKATPVCSSQKAGANFRSQTNDRQGSTLSSLLCQCGTDSPEQMTEAGRKIKVAELISGMRAEQCIDCKSISALCSVAFTFDCKLPAWLLTGLEDWDSCLLQELGSAELRAVRHCLPHELSVQTVEI